jgi:glycosyltransferase involved in cell wall biosynthesis
MVELVSVVIPAFNAAATIDETLRSVRAQSFAALEIIVVDDGSSDDTQAVVARHLAADKRVRYLRQENAGVASARNAGWRAAAGEMIAFVDADDLWAAEKIERQEAMLQESSPKVGVNYCFYTRIGRDGIITDCWAQAAHDGDILDRLLRENFIGGNGSTMLMRRAVLEEAGGFESGFRAAGAEGCDDYLFTCRVAESFHFSVLPEILVGYRETPGSLSSDFRRVLRSRLLAVEILKARHPGKRAILDDSLQIFAEWILRKAVIEGPRGQVPALVAILFRAHKRLTLTVLRRDGPVLGLDLTRRLKARLLRKIKAEPVGVEMPRRFMIGEPASPVAAGEGAVVHG